MRKTIPPTTIPAMAPALRLVDVEFVDKEPLLARVGVPEVPPKAFAEVPVVVALVGPPEVAAANPVDDVSSFA